jgi:hypothetical protein
MVLYQHPRRSNQQESAVKAGNEYLWCYFAASEARSVPTQHVE